MNCVDVSERDVAVLWVLTSATIGLSLLFMVGIAGGKRGGAGED
jgi:hypothetical protein